MAIIGMTLRNVNREENSSRRYVLDAQEDKNATTYFLLSNVLPLLAFDFTSWFNTKLFLFIYLSLACLCVMYNRIDANICLEIAGYRLFRCSLEDNDSNVQENVMVLMKTKQLNKKALFVI